MRKFVLVFVDDILVYSTNEQEHLQHLETVLRILRQHHLLAKASKCSFMLVEIEYLGHLISTECVRTGPQKVAAMLQWPQPATVKSLRGFLGLTGYYRKL